jgi:phosphatidylglycerophosphate synthase
LNGGKANSGSYRSEDRRPIRSRDTGWAAAIANRLAKAEVSPNAISVAGMVAAIVAGFCFAATSWTDGFFSRGLWLSGAVLCQIRLLCNLFDGMVAIQRGVASPVGELYNEVPDRVSDVAVLTGLGFAAGANSWLGWVAAILAVFVAYVRAMARSAGAPQDFCGPMAKPQRMAMVTVLAVYLGLAPAAWQFNSPCFQEFQWSEANIALLIIIVGSVATAVRRLGRAAAFLRKPNP